jgi:hypothetical protein
MTQQLRLASESDFSAVYSTKTAQITQSLVQQNIEFERLISEQVQTIQTLRQDKLRTEEHYQKKLEDQEIIISKLEKRVLELQRKCHDQLIQSNDDQLRQEIQQLKQALDTSHLEKSKLEKQYVF